MAISPRCSAHARFTRLIYEYDLSLFYFECTYAVCISKLFSRSHSHSRSPNNPHHPSHFTELFLLVSLPWIILITSRRCPTDRSPSSTISLSILFTLVRPSIEFISCTSLLIHRANSICLVFPPSIISSHHNRSATTGSHLGSRSTSQCPLPSLIQLSCMHIQYLSPQFWDNNPSDRGQVIPNSSNSEQKFIFIDLLKGSSCSSLSHCSPHWSHLPVLYPSSHLCQFRYHHKVS